MSDKNIEHLETAFYLFLIGALGAPLILLILWGAYHFYFTALPWYFHEVFGSAKFLWSTI